MEYSRGNINEFKEDILNMLNLNYKNGVRKKNIISQQGKKNNHKKIGIKILLFLFFIFIIISFSSKKAYYFFNYNSNINKNTIKLNI